MPTLWLEDPAGTADYTGDPEGHTEGASSAAKAQNARAQRVHLEHYGLHRRSTMEQVRSVE